MSIKLFVGEERIVTDSATTSQSLVHMPDKPSISRRVVLAAAAGLVGTAAVAPSRAAAQTPGAQAPVATPMMPAVQAPVRQEWLARHTEEILEPEVPIIDPHHHLWDQPRYRYMAPELLADLSSGHKIVATMYEQAREMTAPTDRRNSNRLARLSSSTAS